MTELTSTQAYWLGHLFHASSRQLALSKYAARRSGQIPVRLLDDYAVEKQAKVLAPEARQAR